MTTSLPFSFILERPGYAVKQIVPKEAEVLQRLFEKCADFFVMTNGVSALPTAAQAELSEVPEGKSVQDIRVLGLFDPHDTLAGAIVAVQHYPDDQTWWIGLMLLTPEQRRKGLGADFYRTFEQWVAAQGGRHISLCAIAAIPNELEPG